MTSRVKPQTALKRASYKKPTLAVYGKLKDLTTGGSGKASEPGQSKKPRP